MISTEPIKCRFVLSLFILVFLVFGAPRASYGEEQSVRIEAVGKADEDTIIPLRHFRDSYCVEAVLNGKKIGFFLVDTGTSITTIYSNVSKKYSLTPVGRKRVDTFSGPMEQEIVLFETLTIGPLSLKRMLGFVDPSPSRSLPDGAEIAGVLGMDVLGKQPFTIDFRRSTLTLHNPAHYVVPASPKNDLQQDTTVPRIRATVEGAEGWFDIDTGSSTKLRISNSFLNQNPQLVLHRPQVYESKAWGQEGGQIRVYWKSLSFLQHEIHDVSGFYSPSLTDNGRCAGWIGASAFRESKVTIDMSSRTAWCDWLGPEDLDVFIADITKRAETDLWHTSPLLYAVLLGRPDAVNSLLRRGEHADSCDANGVSPLIEAASRENVEITKMLISAGPKINGSAAFDDFTAIAAASLYGRDAACAALVAAGVDVNRPLSSGRTPLFLAAEAGHVAVLRVLGDAHAKIDVKLSTGETPLLAAAKSGSDPCVEYLLHKGANPNATGAHGTCLTYAILVGSVDCVKLLLKAGADVNKLSPEGISPLQIAASANTLAGTDCLRLLLDAGCNLGERTVDGFSALDYAIKFGHIESVKLLLDRADSVSVPAKK